MASFLHVLVYGVLCLVFADHAGCFAALVVQHLAPVRLRPTDEAAVLAWEGVAGWARVSAKCVSWP